MEDPRQPPPPAKVPKGEEMEMMQRLPVRRPALEDDVDDRVPLVSAQAAEDIVPAGDGGPVLSSRIQGYGNTSFLHRPRNPGGILFQGLFSAVKPTAGAAEKAIDFRQISPAFWSFDNFANLVWMILFGWWISLAYLIASVPLFLSYVGIPYGQLCLTMAYYHIWPFDKFLVRSREPGTRTEDLSSSAGYYLWTVVASVFVAPILTVSFFFSWFFVVWIPMAKAERSMLWLLYKRSPLELRVDKDPMGDVEVSIHCSMNWQYYKYSVWGINVWLFNLSPFVIVSLFIGYPLPRLFNVHLPPVVLFVSSLLSIVPLSYYIGIAISNVAAQTSFAIGALINASFGSIIELILFWATIRQGTLDQLVQAAVTGTLLGMLLLLPGLSMIVGGLKYPDQRFSPEAAGVSSVLLIVSIIGAFTPTIFYQIYGGYSLECTACDSLTIHGVDCTGCQLLPPWHLDSDVVFVSSARPLMYVCAAILPIAYAIGLLFTLKTHQHLFQGEGQERHAEERPAQLWSLPKCLIILVICTTAFALISEEMADKMSQTLDEFGIDQAFAGLTIIGIIPSIAEYVAAIMFALNDNVALSIEIGSSSAVQLSLLQIPALVALSAMHKYWFNAGEEGFTLIFPPLDLFAVIFAVIIVNYVSIDGRSNYFIGSALVIIYALLVAAFYFVPPQHKYPGT